MLRKNCGDGDCVTVSEVHLEKERLKPIERDRESLNPIWWGERERECSCTAVPIEACAEQYSNRTVVICVQQTKERRIDLRERRPRRASNVFSHLLHMYCQLRESMRAPLDVSRPVILGFTSADRLVFCDGVTHSIIK